MLVYLSLLLISLILLMIRNSNFYSNELCKNFIYLFFTILLFVIYVFRSYSVGEDYPMYHGLYMYDTYYELREHFIESGYAYLNQFAQMENNFLLIPIFVFVILFIGIYLMSKEFNINKFTISSFLILIYFFFMSFNIMRQAIAIGIICIGVYLFFKYYDKTFIKFLLFICLLLIAKQFHNTALFAILFLLLPYFHCGKKSILISCIFTVIFFYTNIISNIFNKLLLIFPSYFVKYNNISVNTTITNSTFKVIALIAQFIFIYVFVSKNHRFSIMKFSKTRFILNGYIFSLIMYSAYGSSIAVRLQVYASIFQLLFACIFVDGISVNGIKIDNITKLDKFCFIIFWMFMYIMRLLLNNASIVPYSII